MSVTIGTIGAGAAVVGPNSGPIAAAVVLTVGGAVVVEAVRIREAGAPRRPSYEVVALSAFSVLAAAGLGTLIGAAAGWVCLLALITCPGFFTAARNVLLSTRTATSQTGLVVGGAAPTLFLPAHGALPSMSTAELCSAWERSCLALMRLHRSGATHAQLQVVLARQHYLDELESRNPPGFARWLGRGAEALDSPSRYLLS